MPADQSEPTALYRLYGADDVLLYIGIARDPKARWAFHAYTARRSWWPEVARKEVQWLASRTEALAAELAAIRSEKPQHNVDGVPSPLNLDDRAGRIARVNKRAREPEFEQVATELRGAIERGELTPGDRLPSFAELRAFFGVSVTTAQRALRALKDGGLVEGRKGNGVYVREPQDRTITIPIARPESAALLLREAMSPTDLATLARLLAEPDDAAPPA